MDVSNYLGLLDIIIGLFCLYNGLKFKKFRGRKHGPIWVRTWGTKKFWKKMSSIAIVIGLIMIFIGILGLFGTIKLFW